MKRTVSIIICVVLCICIFGGCSKSSGIVGDRRLKPTETIKAEDLIPEDEFPGTFVNADYTMVIEKAEDETMKVLITSAVKDRVSYEWSISAYFSAQTYRLNYTDAVKTQITYDKNGNEESRKIIYENGAGRIQFSDSSKLKWEDSAESIENNEFVKK